MSGRKIIYIKNPSSGSHFRTLGGRGGGLGNKPRSGGNGVTSITWTFGSPLSTAPTHHGAGSTLKGGAAGTTTQYAAPWRHGISINIPTGDWKAFDKSHGIATWEDWKNTSFSDIFDFNAGTAVKGTTWAKWLNPVEWHKGIMASEGGYASLGRDWLNIRGNDKGTYGEFVRNKFLAENPDVSSPNLEK